MAEVELAILTTQVLRGRIADLEALRERVTAWFMSGNARRGPIRLRFTTADARIKLAPSYPALHE